MSAYLYILRCTDGSYYVGTTRASLDERIAQHNAGTFDGYMARRRPVILVFHEHFDRITDAIGAERKVKGWRREKKEALIRGDYAMLRELPVAYQKRCSNNQRPSTGSG
jgi:putative endonuclease